MKDGYGIIAPRLASVTDFKQAPLQRQIFFGKLSVKTSVMRTQLLALVMGCLIVHTSAAQNSIEPIKKYEGTVDYQKTKQPATIFEFKYPPRDLEAAVERYIQKRGGTVKQAKGLSYAKQVRLSENENAYYDVYYKVDGTGKGAVPMSVLSVILAQPGEDILLRDPTNTTVSRAATSTRSADDFFASMGAEVGAYDLEKKITDQEGEVKKTEKRLSDLEKKKMRLEKELIETAQEIEKQKAELEKQGAILAQFKEQRRQ